MVAPCHKMFPEQLLLVNVDSVFHDHASVNHQHFPQIKVSPLQLQQQFISPVSDYDDDFVGAVLLLLFCWDEMDIYSFKQ